MHRVLWYQSGGIAIDNKGNSKKSMANTAETKCFNRSRQFSQVHCDFYLTDFENCISDEITLQFWKRPVVKPTAKFF